MGITRKIENLRSSLDRNRPTASSKRDSVHDTTGAKDTTIALPIAEQFMHSPTMSSNLSRSSQDDDFERAIRRKPLPSETDKTPSQALPQTSTMRTVPSQNATPDTYDAVKRSSDVDRLAPNFSKLNMGKPLDRSEMHNTANQLPETDTWYEANTHPTITRRSLDKPLPMPPVTESERGANGDTPGSYDQRAVSLSKAHDLERQLGVEGVVDLSNTTDVEVLEKWAPAVTHETITRNIHEVREEQITREIHEHHYFHRIQPVEEVEVLPARHYMLDGQGLIREVPAQQVAARASRDVQSVVAEGFKKMLPKSNSTAGSKTFTAREFRGDEGDYKEYTTPEGIARTERTWVHAPTLQTGGAESGQTQPFHLGSSRPEHDGWRSGI